VIPDHHGAGPDPLPDADVGHELGAGVVVRRVVEPDGPAPWSMASWGDTTVSDTEKSDERPSWTTKLRISKAPSSADANESSRFFIERSSIRRFCDVLY
jgi:hypothetical protein